MAGSPGKFALAAGFVVVLFAWGFNYVFVRDGLGLAGPLWLAAFRAGVGAIAVLLFRLGTGRDSVLPGSRRWEAALLGIPNTALFFGLWFVAAGSVLPGETAVIIYTFPLWVAVLAGPVLGDRLGPLHWAAIVAGFVGVGLVSQPWAGGTAALRVAPLFELLGGAVSWAVGTVLMQRRFRPDELQEANSCQLVGGAVALLAIALAFEGREVPAPSPTLFLVVLWLGVVGTAVAYSIWFYLLGRVPAATLSAFTFLVPLIALAASAGFYGERLDILQVGGVVLVVGAIILVAQRARGRSSPDGPASPGVPRGTLPP